MKIECEKIEMSDWNPYKYNDWIMNENLDVTNLVRTSFRKLWIQPTKFEQNDLDLNETRTNRNRIWTDILNQIAENNTMIDNCTSQNFN